MRMIILLSIVSIISLGLGIFVGFLAQIFFVPIAVILGFNWDKIWNYVAQSNKHMKKETMNIFLIEKGNNRVEPFGENIGSGYYATYSPSLIVADFAFDYKLFKNGKLIFESPIVKMTEICQGC